MDPVIKFAQHGGEPIVDGAFLVHEQPSFIDQGVQGVAG